MTTDPSELGETLWQRFHADDRSTFSSRWGLVAIAVWIATQEWLWLS